MDCIIDKDYMKKYNFIMEFISFMSVLKQFIIKLVSFAEFNFDIIMVKEYYFTIKFMEKDLIKYFIFKF
jgi:hypothetical protein